MNKCRLSSHERHLIRKFYKKGYTITKISHKLNHAPSTVWRHLSGIENRITPVKFNKYLYSEIGEFMGAFAGDGSLDLSSGSYKIKITLNEKEGEYAKYLVNIIHMVFNKNSNIWHFRKEHTLRLTVNGKKLIKIINKFLYFGKDKTHTIRLRKRINYYNKEFLKGYIRGLISTDGYINNSKSLRIQYSSVSKNLAKNLYDILIALGISARFYKQIRESNNNKKWKIYRVEINKLVDINNFCDSIGLFETNRLSKLLW